MFGSKHLAVKDLHLAVSAAAPLRVRRAGFSSAELSKTSPCSCESTQTFMITLAGGSVYDEDIERSTPMHFRGTL